MPVMPAFGAWEQEQKLVILSYKVSSKASLGYLILTFLTLAR